MAMVNLNRKLSPHFRLIEFVRSTTADKLHIDNTPTDEIIDHLIVLCEQVLEPARALLGRLIQINSGYRCPELNKAVNGSRNSGHLRGYAADLRLFDADYTNKITAIMATNNFVTELLLEHRGSSIWLHVSCDPAVSPRRINLNYKA